MVLDTDFKRKYPTALPASKFQIVFGELGAFPEGETPSGAIWREAIEETILRCLELIPIAEHLLIVCNSLHVTWGAIETLALDLFTTGDMVSPLAELPISQEPEFLAISGEPLRFLMQNRRQGVIQDLLQTYKLQRFKDPLSRVVRYREWLHDPEFKFHTISFEAIRTGMLLESLDHA